MKHIIKNAIIHYKDGSRKKFKAISIELNGVYTGYFSVKDEKNTVFIDSGFVPIELIEKICNLSTGKDDLIIDFKRNKKEERKKWKRK